MVSSRGGDTGAALFISSFSRKAWGWAEDEADVLVHGIDTDLFSPDERIEKEAHSLSVVNDWVNRDWCCGFNLWRDVSQGVPTFVVGDTPGLSQPAGSTQELVDHYRRARLFLNTSLVSPVPTALMEAMSCGLPPVSTETCMIPEVIDHGRNGFLSNDPKELRSYVQLLLHDEQLAQQMGQEARRTIIERFSLGQFVDRWSQLFEETSRWSWSQVRGQQSTRIVYRG